MPLVGTEQEIVQTLENLKQARTASIAHQLSISPDYAHYLCRQLLRRGYIERSSSSAYQLTSKGRRHAQGKDTEYARDTVSIQVIAKEVAKELKKEGAKRQAQIDSDDKRENRRDVMKEESEREKIKIKQGMVSVTEDYAKSYTCNFDKGIVEKRIPDGAVKKSTKKLINILT